MLESRTSPTRVTQHVRRLKKQISNSLEPILVPVSPRHSSKPRDCFADVAEQIQELGGTIQYGWTVWEWPEVLIEGEFHGIWRSPTGELVDVSQKPDGEKQIMFIPDTKRIFLEKPLDNIRLPIGKDWRIKRFIELHEKFYKLKCEAGKDIPFGHQIPVSSEMQKIWDESAKLEKELLAKNSQKMQKSVNLKYATLVRNYGTQ